jgi:cell cycle checkpoint control protein RAD9A
MHTSVAVERKDFNDFNVQEGLHIGTMVKDFRSIIAHAETVRTQVAARYSRGNRPMQISYGEGGLKAEFTLMTRGSTNIPSTASNASTRATPARDLSMRSASRPADTPAPTSGSAQAGEGLSTDAAGHMPPPSRISLRDRGLSKQPSLPKADSAESAAPSASINEDSLFIPGDNDDRQWEEPNFDEEPDIVTWENPADNSVSASNSTRRIRDSEMMSFASMQERERQQQEQEQRSRTSLTRSRFPIEIEPTQRLSQFKGVFD